MNKIYIMNERSSIMKKTVKLLKEFLFRFIAYMLVFYIVYLITGKELYSSITSIILIFIGYLLVETIWVNVIKKTKFFN